MTRYERGTRFERKVIARLRVDGYLTIRAAGSKGESKIDVIAIKRGQLLFCQCKIDGVLGPAEWDRVYEVAGMVGAVPLLAANGPRGRGVEFIRLEGPKRRNLPMDRQQCSVFHLDEIAAATGAA